MSTTPERHVRALQQTHAAALGRAGETAPASTPSFIGQVVAGTTLPTVPDVWYLVNPVEIDGPEGEGAAPAFTADSTRKVPVLVIGDRAPKLGDMLNVFGVSGKWVAEVGCGAVKDNCPGGGTLCVALTSTCAGDAGSYSVVVKPHGSSTVVATGTPTFPPFSQTASICFTLPVGSYDVTATKAGCDSKSWSAQAVTCGATTNLAAVVACAANTAVVFSIKGCGSAPLPDAVITYTGPDSGTLTTDAGGNASFVTGKTGSWSYTVTHPSNRFQTGTGNFSRASACTGVNAGMTLLPAAGYNCCSQFGSYWPTPNPYPIPNNLFITDGKGFTMPFTLATDCTAFPCETRDMDNASPSPEVAYTCKDTSGGAFVPPPDIGVFSTAFFWDVTLGPPGTMLLRQHYPISNPTGLAYVNGGDVSGRCLNPDTRRMWRLVETCANGNANNFQQYSTTQSSLTVNSVYPLNISFTFTVGPDGFGPVPVNDPVSGVPYTTSAVIHE